MLEVIIKKQIRQSGKSYDIAQLMKLNRDIVCVQPTEMHRDLFCKKYRFDERRVITFHKLLSMEIKPKMIIIDEVGCCLDVHLKTKILYGTHTD